MSNNNNLSYAKPQYYVTEFSKLNTKWKIFLNKSIGTQTSHWVKIDFLLFSYIRLICIII